MKICRRTLLHALVGSLCVGSLSAGSLRSGSVRGGMWTAVHPTSIQGPAEDGLRFYQQGLWKAAAASFREALDADPDDPRLNYNLALALWRAGDSAGAETAAEKAAALDPLEFGCLRDGILGGLRYDSARALADTKPRATPGTTPGTTPAPTAPTPEPPSEVEILEQAVALAGNAREHLQRGALDAVRRAPTSGAEMLRNLERTIRLEEELKKRLEEAVEEPEPKAPEKKKSEQKSDNDKKPEDKNKDKNDKNEKDSNEEKDSQEEKQKGDEKDEQKQDPDQKESKEKSEPDPDEERKNEPEKDEKKEDTEPEDQKGDDRGSQGSKPQEVPGEHDPDKELTPEQKRALLNRLKEFEENLQKIRAARRAARPKVEKDW